MCACACACACVCACVTDLGRGVDPDGGVEEDVVTQLFEQHDAVLQVTQVAGEGQDDVQHRPRHVHLGRLDNR